MRRLISLSMAGPLRRLIPLLGLLPLACSVPDTPPAATPASTPIVEQPPPVPSLAPMLEEATPAVVNIATESTVAMRGNPLLDDPFFQRFFDLPERQEPEEQRVQSLGSGVVVDAVQGYIVTNHHVIDQADSITITLRDGRSFEATVVGSDPDTDVALIRIDAEELVALPLADSDRLRVGDYVVAIGNPFGLGQTVTSGIISALGRTGLGLEGYEDFIQTDAAINVGNSGGALVNLNGELVGLNTAIFAPGGGNVGIGFAIPVNLVARLLDQILTYGEVRRGQLGVRVQTLGDELTASLDSNARRGAVIDQVLPDSAAARAGLMVGDIVTGVDGRPVRNASDLRNLIGLREIGEQVALEILRDGDPITVQVAIGEMIRIRATLPEPNRAASVPQVL